MADSENDVHRECESKISHLKVRLQLQQRQCTRWVNWGRAVGFGAGTIVGTLIGAAVWRRRPAPAEE